MKDKIYIIGHSADLTSSLIGKRLSENEQVEFITAEQAAEMNIHSLRPKPISVPIIVPPSFNIYFQPPLTRRERRKQKRKNK